jgi:hypothetical protein
MNFFDFPPVVPSIVSVLLIYMQVKGGVHIRKFISSIRAVLSKKSHSVFIFELRDISVLKRKLKSK